MNRFMCLRTLAPESLGAIRRRVDWQAVAILVAVSFLILPAATFAARCYSQLILTFHPEVYWRLGERIGSTIALDSSGNHHNATYEDVILGLPGAITADPNTSALFDDIGDDVVWVPASSYAGPFTIVTWIKNTGATGNAEQTFFDTRTPLGDYSFDFKLSNGNLKVDVGNGSTWFLTGPGIPFNFQLNTWYMVAAVITSTTATLYVNGRQIGAEQYPSGTPLLFDPDHAVYLGTNALFNTTEWFKGGMDEVAVFLRPLQSETIAMFYIIGKSFYCG
jgi:hypothetical protein